MYPSEREGCQRVVEGCLLPPVGGMTPTTVLAELARMRVVAGMTSMAFLGSILQVRDGTRPTVAVRTGRGGVLPQ